MGYAAYLSALLKGRVLDVYDSLSTEDKADYDKLKDALLIFFLIYLNVDLGRSFVMVGPKSRKRLYSSVAKLP